MGNGLGSQFWEGVLLSSGGFGSWFYLFPSPLCFALFCFTINRAFFLSLNQKKQIQDWSFPGIGFFAHETVDVLGPDNYVAGGGGGEWPVHCGTFSSFPGLPTGCQEPSLLPSHSQYFLQNILYVSHLHTPHSAQTSNPKIRSGMLCLLSQLGAPSHPQYFQMLPGEQTRRTVEEFGQFSIFLEKNNFFISDVPTLLDLRSS